MILFLIRQRLKSAGGVLAIIVLAAPRIGFAQPTHDPEQQGETQFVISNQQQQIVENLQVQDLACSRPSMLIIPDNARIKRRAKRELRDGMRVYVTEMANYADCVRRSLAAAETSNASTDAILSLAEQYNAAVDELVAVGDAYVARVGPIEELTEDRRRSNGVSMNDGIAASNRALSQGQASLRAAQRQRAQIVRMNGGVTDGGAGGTGD